MKKTELFKPAVGADPGVQFTVGQYHFSQQDYATALKYFEKAAGVRKAKATGDGHFSSQAKYQLGVMYFDGLGVKEDPVSLPSPTPSEQPTTIVTLHIHTQV